MLLVTQLLNEVAIYHIISLRASLVNLCIHDCLPIDALYLLIWLLVPVDISKLYTLNLKTFYQLVGKAKA